MLLVGFNSVSAVSWSRMLFLLPKVMGHLLASWPNEIVAIDFTILEPSLSSQENVLVMTDVFIKFIVAVLT